ncbi:MAG: hypothetical protein GY696_02145 [Gammaproteobacteria bacterium]|nr:hypothetical protein [Gammaproteobacteria bacterium]
MVRQLEYTLPGQATGLPLRLNKWNFFSVTASGDLEAFPDHVECQGEETRHGDKLTENEIVLLELRIMVRDEHFLINHGVIESQMEHTMYSAGKQLPDFKKDLHLERHRWRLQPPPHTTIAPIWS